jgi:hypothetical protein
MTAQQADIARFDQAAEHDRGLLHQRKAWKYLQENTPLEVQRQFTKMFREGQATGAGGMSAISRKLKVAYESQNDNRSGTGYRECFSSSCGAIARFHGRVSSDDEYNVVRQRYGDTTDPQAQVRALEALGLKATFLTNGTPELVKNEIVAGFPVATGWAHKGPLHAPVGSGHWSVVTGFTEKHAIHSDPNGEADIINGGYVNHSGGDGVAYSWANWRMRWEIVGSPALWRFSPGNGWMLTVRP